MNITRPTFRIRRQPKRPTFQLRQRPDGTFESIICCTGGCIRFFGPDKDEVYDRARRYELA